METFGGSWDGFRRLVLGTWSKYWEWENLPVAPDDGKGQKLMEPYHAEHKIYNLKKKTENYKYLS